MTAASDITKLWFWPLETMRAAGCLLETAVATQSVLSARLPMIAAAASNPFDADHRELSLMVSEKVDAFGRSGRSVMKASAAVQRASDANVHDLGRLARGELICSLGWMTLFERNLQVTTTLMSLPIKALAPIHKGVTANARRLRRS